MTAIGNTTGKVIRILVKSCPVTDEQLPDSFWPYWEFQNIKEAIQQETEKGENLMLLK